MKKGLLYGIIGLLCLVNCFGQQVDYTLSALEQHTVTAVDGIMYTGESGWIKVPENRDSKTSKFIELPFFRIKTEHKDPLPPIFIFEGGPGDDPSALERLAEFAPLLYSFTSRSDLVLVDQRGNGRAKPKLNCPGTLGFALDAPLSMATFRRVYREYMGDCSNSWQERQHDLSGYNVMSMADDTEAVRQALSYGKIMLFGGSFGSHHALAYVKKYPKQVDRILLDSPEGLKHTIKLPYTADKILNQLSELVKTNAELSKEIPSFIDLVQEILKQLEESPVTVKTRHPISNTEVDIVLGKLDLQLVTAQDLGRRAYRALPYHYLQMKNGDYSWLAARAIGMRLNHSESLMAALTDGASGLASQRRGLVKQQAKDAILGDALNNVIFDVLDVLPLKDISKDLNDYFKCSVPLVLICGSQDARTPVSNAKEILENFENARLVIVEHGSHDLYSEALEQLAPLMIGYLSAEDPMKFKIPEEIVAPLDLKMR